MGSRGNAKAAPRVAALDGIRVLAIVGVVVYHANSSWLPGGFLGVTVFFVISGYLITSGLLKQLRETGRIGYWEHICKRVRRLWPTMLVVVLATAILAAMFAPVLLQKMQPDAVPALTFFSNWWYLIQNLSYFAASGQPSPLTHFWYLAVLFQFYLVWPLVMTAVWKVRPSRRTFQIVSVVFTVASFALMLAQFDPAGDSSRVYYGTDTRLAEIMVGCLLGFTVPLGGTKMQRFPRRVAVPSNAPLCRKVEAAVFGNHMVSDVVGAACLAAIVVMAFLVNGFSPFLYRGGLLLVAVLVAVLITVVSNPHSLLGKVLGLKVFRVAGARSFAVYLWHYPLLLIMNPATRTTDLPWWGWVLELLAICAVSCLSYQFVEKRTGSGQIGGFFRELRADGPVSAFMSRMPVSAIAGVLMLASVLLLAIGPVWAYYEINQLEPPKTTLEKLQSIDPVKAIDDRVFSVDESGATSLKMLLIGDSVAAGCKTQFAETFPNGYIDAEVSRPLTAGPACCEAAYSSGYDPDVVVFALGTNGMATEEGIEALIEAAGGKKVYLVNNRVPQSQQDMNNALFEQIASKHENVSVIDWYGTSSGHDDWFWNDGTHLRPEGAEEYVRMVRDAVTS